MKIIITNKSNLGKIGDIIDVKSGFGNNYLIKNGLAVKDSVIARQQIKAVLAGKKKVKVDKNLELNKAIGKLKKKAVLNMHANANEIGHLYAAISLDDFIMALKDQLGVITTNLDVKLLTVIKELGKVEAEFSINNIIKKITINIKQLNDSQTD